jgi:hypothetical protein
LRTLAALRGGVAEGERMQHLFWRLNFLLLSGATHTARCTTRPPRWPVSLIHGGTTAAPSL